MIDVEPCLDILLVDDCDSDRLITGIVLQRSQLSNPVVMLDSAEAAIAYLRKLADDGRPPPALAIFDVNMHGMDDRVRRPHVHSQPRRVCRVPGGRGSRC